MTWTQNEEKKLREWYGVFSPDEIAEKLGKTANAIHLHAMKLGLTYEVTGMSSPQEIGERHNLDQGTVRKILKAATEGVGRIGQGRSRGKTKKVYDDFFADEVVEAYKEAVTLNKLGEILGLSYNATKYLLLGYDPVFWLTKLGLIDKDTVKAIVEEYKEMLKHKSISEFSQNVGSDPTTIKRVMHSLGIYYNTEKKFSPKEMALIEANLPRRGRR